MTRYRNVSTKEKRWKFFIIEKNVSCHTIIEVLFKCDLLSFVIFYFRGKLRCNLYFKNLWPIIFQSNLVWRLRCCFCFSAKFYSNLISWWNKKGQFLHLINAWKEWIVFFTKSTRYDFVRIVSYYQLGFKIMMLPENNSITTDI